ncbi:geranylgeranylglyceryl/heptaprenylglyceryl phosphate synthase [Flavobacterium sp. N2270]|uniref:geranylgeranylglyceryl/heptaprenylglyceryl phosphate synthase n=1 Tax=Flavobacterium sp. N2270 TaxID=2986831 RepID=UPI0022256751|nr:geranylgeranylglyceryl/heptaprenylglyceryl phosphate synthase [Flavobacterium sp. N2270]
MKELYTNIVQAKNENSKLLAILLDPEKLLISDVKNLCKKINESPATHIFIGGSTYNGNHLDGLIKEIKQCVDLPLFLFPGDYKQISAEADAILFLSLLSGRNADYLIEHQVNAVPVLEKTKLEIIPTGYLLIESGIETAVERVSNTKPLDRNNINYVCQTAKAGELLGNKLIYLEAGSGAKLAVSLEMIEQVAQSIQIPLIVGGGIRSKKEINDAFNAGADMVVIGTAFENDNTFFELC